MKLIKFNDLSVAATACNYNYKGFHLLRICGTETAINAVVARLMSSDLREKEYETKVVLTNNNVDIPIAAQKSKYRVIRSRLSSALIDAIILHTGLMPMSDTSESIRIASFSPGIPQGFYRRLDKCLRLPLLPEWEEKLWELGQLKWRPKAGYYGETPIVQESFSHSFGVFHYTIKVEKCQNEWEAIIKSILGVSQN